MQLVVIGHFDKQNHSANATTIKHLEHLMKKFLSIIASAAILAMPLAVISTPAAAQTSAPVAAPTTAPKAAPAVKAKQSKAKVTHKARHAKAKAKIAPKAA